MYVCTCVHVHTAYRGTDVVDSINRYFLVFSNFASLTIKTRCMIRVYCLRFHQPMHMQLVYTPPCLLYIRIKQ